MDNLLKYVIVDHFGLAVDSAFLFAAGLFISIPAVKYRLAFLQWLPLRLMDLVNGLMGQRANMMRMISVIWIFNSSVMFISMASGFHPLLPKILGIWTGLNIGVILGHSRRDGAGARPPEPPADAWRPPPGLTFVCSILVLAVELPCFFYSLALGMRMGAEVAWGEAAYLEALPLRAAAYASVVIPALLFSAAAEAIAIRGTAGPDAC